MICCENIVKSSTSHFYLFIFFETNIDWEFFHQHSRQSTINPTAINHHHVQGHPAKTNSIIFFFFFFQFQQRNHTRYCIGKCLYINIRSDLHWKNSTHTKKKKVNTLPKLCLKLTRKIDAAVRNGLKCCNYTFYWAVVFVFLKCPNDISFKCHF